MEFMECRRDVKEKSDLWTGGRGRLRLANFAIVLFIGLGLTRGMSSSSMSRMNSFSSSTVRLLSKMTCAFTLLFAVEIE
jgi:hypothetical protein